MAAEDNPPVPRLSIGPIIGKTTATGTRVLLEAAARVEATLVLTPMGSAGDEDVAKSVIDGVERGEDVGGEERRVDVLLEEGVPVVVAVDGLDSATVYRVRVQGVANEATRVGRVTTLGEGGALAQLRVVVASCDKPKNRGDVNMFQQLWETQVYPGRVDVMVRHGDQVYADEAFKACKPILRNKKLSEEEKHTAMLEEYKKIYRATWGADEDEHIPTMLVMSHVQQLMLWDDHELRNDWGTFTQDRDPDSVDYKIALVAREAYWMYQKQLWCDTWDQDTTEGVEMHFHRWGPFGIYFCDTRGTRSFGYQDVNAGRYVGEMQMSTIDGHLNGDDGMYANGVQSVLAVHSQPAVYMSGCSSACVACLPCMTDKMGFGLNNVEQQEYLSMLVDWKRKRDDRDVLLIGGDLHYSMETTIYDENGEPALNQLITSAISNKPPPSLMSCLLRCCCMCPCCNGTGTEFTFKHTDRTYDYNYTIVTMKPSAISYSVVFPGGKTSESKYSA